MPEELEGMLTNQEYEDIRDIMQNGRNTGLGTALGISLVLATALTIAAIAQGDYSILGSSWCTAIPWSIFPMSFMPMAKAKVNAEILNPKGMNLQHRGCLSFEIVPSRSSGSSADQTVGVLETMVFEEKSRSDHVLGRRERERAPANYGTVELTHSSNDDVGEEVVRNMYTHISNGTVRSEGIIACNKKIVYVPEVDLADLVQVYKTRQMGELRATLRREDRARRVIRFFYNNGSSFAAGSD